MQIKGTIRFFAIVFILVSVYSLSFTFCSRKVEKDAKEYAYSEDARALAQQLANGDTLKERMLFDSIGAAWENRYLDSMANEVVYNLLIKKYTYRECKEKELNLGLDLKGGMNVTLEISESDIIIALSGNNKDPNFIKAVATAVQRQQSSQTEFLTLFVESLRELEPTKPLAAYFLTRDMSDKIKTNSTDEEVIQVLQSEIDGAIERTFMVLRKRIDKFGVTQPNIQKLNAQGRILVELPGVKDPTRVRKILQGTAKLEFWETWEFTEVYPKLVDADKRIKTMISKQVETGADTTAKKDSLAADTAKAKQPATLEEQMNATASADTSGMTDEQKAQSESPLLSLFAGFNVFESEGQQYPGQGPLVGFVPLKDTAQVNALLKKTADMFPNTRFLWGAKPAQLETPGTFLELIAIKVSTTDGIARLEGDNIADAWQDYDQNGRVEVSMTMTSEGSRIWKKMTAEASAMNPKRCIAIVLDDYVYSYPTVQDEIAGGRSQISGSFTVAEAQDLANVLKSGKLPAPARIVEEAIVGPSLGLEAINAGILSFIIAFILVLVYMLFFYNKAGIAANIALVTNVVFIFGVLSSMGAVLTLPGIAGIVLTLGMAVDSNVIIYERIKEELRAGKGVRLAVDDGYKAAYSAIIDGNVTTLLVAVVLAWFGSGPVQGFATTLIIGILTSLFTSIFISRLFFINQLERNKKVTFDNKITRNFLSNTQINFIKTRKVAYLLSGSVIAIGLFFLFTKGLNFGVDFSGGRTYVVRFDKDVAVNDIRTSMFKEFGETPEVKTFGGNNQVKITTKYLINENNPATDSIVEVKVFNAVKGFYSVSMTFDEFTSDDPDKVLGRLSSQKVGPTIADDIKRSAVYAIIIALIIVFIYIAIRFNKWFYGLGGVIALFHDALITVSLFSIFYGILPFNLEVDQTFIAAILTIIGYSINDTVIIFDRIREYNTLFPKRSIAENMNGAINSTLGRTLNTAGTTIVVLLAIFILGGEIIRGFSFALLVGILVGTYSSVFVASPIAFEFINRKKKEVK